MFFLFLCSVVWFCNSRNLNANRHYSQIIIEGDLVDKFICSFSLVNFTDYYLLVSTVIWIKWNDSSDFLIQNPGSSLTYFKIIDIVGLFSFKYLIFERWTYTCGWMCMNLRFRLKIKPKRKSISIFHCELIYMNWFIILGRAFNMRFCHQKLTWNRFVPMNYVVDQGQKKFFFCSSNNN